jgi:hypothetical protein
MWATERITLPCDRIAIRNQYADSSASPQIYIG